MKVKWFDSKSGQGWVDPTRLEQFAQFIVNRFGIAGDFSFCRVYHLPDSPAFEWKNYTLYPVVGPYRFYPQFATVDFYVKGTEERIVIGSPLNLEGFNVRINTGEVHAQYFARGTLIQTDVLARGHC